MMSWWTLLFLLLPSLKYLTLSELLSCIKLSIFLSLCWFIFGWIDWFLVPKINHCLKFFMRWHRVQKFFFHIVDQISKFNYPLLVLFLTLPHLSVFKVKLIWSLSDLWRFRIRWRHLGILTWTPCHYRGSHFAFNQILLIIH